MESKGKISESDRRINPEEDTREERSSDSEGSL
jgi:hypothetical protein